eukprot:Phypoly_transcript_03672.p1 GENE.Phypoly_transcript_03672~~Phypoly_transcript_03672.p1  ORF type:complete len:254 (+),score=17.78 Phypoly_transcript_03672:1610-2371(+)
MLPRSMLSRQCAATLLSKPHLHSRFSSIPSTPTPAPSISTPASPVSTPASPVSSPAFKLDTQERRKRIVVAMTGSTGAVYGIRILEVLKELNVETHLVMSKWAEATIKYETDFQPDEIRALAYRCYSIRDLAAPIASGSFPHEGMVVAPCTMKTLAGIRTGYSDDVITRSADVVLKEKRRLVLVVRETPLSDIHLDNMLFLSRSGAVIFPPVPAFYTKPKTLDDMVNQSVGRILDALNIPTDGFFERWTGFKK